MIGETIGNYLVTAKLGEGGMGAVFLAVHRVIGRKVAVKVLRPEGSADAEMLHRFFLEARSTATLRHPSLIDVMDFGTNRDGSPYIIMEYVDGESLAARIQRVGRLPLATLIDVSRQIANGIGVAHAAGIVHRDLKPGNVLLCGTRAGQLGDTVKILDFGIAKLMSPDPLVGPLTQMSAFMGTPLYMAPEQCLGAGNVDHRADIYALGCMMYEMACGEPPFASPQLRELISAHLGGKPVPPRTHRPEVPLDLEAIILKALAKSPSSRQSHMNEVVESLDACARGPTASQAESTSRVDSSAGSVFPVSKPAPAPSPSLVDPNPTWLPRRRSFLWVAAAGAALALTAAAAVWVPRRSAVARPEPPSPVVSSPPTALPSPTLSSPTPAAPSVDPVPTASESTPPRIAVPASAQRPPSKAPHASPGQRDRPSPAAVPSQAPADTPSLGGEEIENPWPK